MTGCGPLPFSCRITAWLRAALFSLLAALGLADAHAGDHLMHGGGADPLVVPAWDDVFAEGAFDLPEGDTADADHCLKQGQLALMELRDDAAERWFRAVLRKRPDDVAALWGLAAACVDRPGRSAAFARRAVEKCTADTPDRDRSMAEFFSQETAPLKGAPTGALSRSAALSRPQPWLIDALPQRFADIRDRHLYDPVAGMIDARQHLHHFRPPSLHRIKLAEALEWLPLQRENLQKAQPPMPESEAILTRIMAATGVAGTCRQDETSPLLCFVTAGTLIVNNTPHAALPWLDRMARLSSGILRKHPAEPRAMRWLHDALTEKAHLEASLGLVSAAVESAAAAGPECTRAVLIRLAQWDLLAKAAEQALPLTAPDTPERLQWLAARTLTDILQSRREAARAGLAELRETRSRWEQTPGAATPEQAAELQHALTELECRQALADGMRPLASDLLLKLAAVMEPSRYAEMSAECGGKPSPPDRVLPARYGIPEVARLIKATGQVPPVPAWLKLALTNPAADGALADGLRAELEITPGKPPQIPAHMVPEPCAEALWTAPEAPPFSLPDATGAVHIREALKGSPALVVFFLGARCDHCLQQLDTLKAWKPRLDAAGVKIISISVNGPEGVQQTFAGPDRSARQPYPFPVLADPEFSAFRAWGAWDAYDRAPVHGTFLLDATGKVLWRHAGTQPFMRIDILHALAIQAGKG